MRWQVPGSSREVWRAGGRCAWMLPHIQNCDAGVDRDSCDKRLKHFSKDTNQYEVGPVLVVVKYERSWVRVKQVSGWLPAAPMSDALTTRRADRFSCLEAMENRQPTAPFLQELDNSPNRWDPRHSYIVHDRAGPGFTRDQRHRAHPQIRS